MIYDLTYIRVRSGFEEIEEFFLWMLSCQALNNMSCVNTNGNTMLSEEQEVSLRIIFGVRFCQRPTMKDVGLRVAESCTAIQRCELSLKELDKFLSSYSIPLEYHVILPMPTQTILNALPGYIGLYTHCFSLANLRFPLNDFFYEEVPENQRADAANSLVYEANVRLRDPVYGCMGAISALQHQVQSLQAELNAVRSEILRYKYSEPQNDHNIIPSTHHLALLSTGVVAVTTQALPPPPSTPLPPPPPPPPPPPRASSSSSMYTPPSATTDYNTNITNDNISYFG
nr:hypothetical protein [Tanacetum cinerariifolium]